MKILILGATGRTGRLIVEEAIKQGHALNVLVRDIHKIPFDSKSINVFQGTPARREDLAAAMQGCDLLISALSIARASDAPWSKLITPENFISECVKNIIAEAGQQNIQRLISISAWGVGDTNKDIPFWLRWLIKHTNLRPVYAEHESQEKLLAASSLQWTAVRPVALNDAKKIKTLKISFNNLPKPSLYISRHSVAKFIVDIIKSNGYVCKSPTISEH
ncbi:NAD(P)-dependent oxidoreductase [Arachidicoccus soli]|uniref:NAD-dependent epimerase/dehydratase family protein n=1 Tax=Arachidicoccus soli TaxID=2341117 RepID=A0A386HRJ2_9BACT|nr:NAD(P)H-binding protein [Arachidicoccus soli]AYD48100.1 NAD-dependent epimerase/dehydratase family protein [Arachidicoccus soli]